MFVVCFALFALSKMMTEHAEVRLQKFFVRPSSGARRGERLPQLTTGAWHKHLYTQLVTKAHPHRSLVMVWIRSRPHG
jgi:hypothetical protein